MTADAASRKSSGFNSIGLAVRRAVGGVIPGVEVFPQRARVGDALLGDDPLQRREPVPVIGLAGVGIAGGLRLLDLVAEDRRPLRPLEQPAVYSDSVSAKACASHGSRNTGPSASQGMLGTARGRVARRRDRLRSHARRYAGSRYGSNASIEIFEVGSASGPHSSRLVEHHRVEPLRIVALIGRDRVRIHVAAVAHLDHADLVAGVARQPRVRRRMDVLGAHPVARLELLRALRLAVERAARQPAPTTSGVSLRGRFLPGRLRVAGLQFLRRGIAALGDVALHRQHPALVVGRAEIVERRQLLLREARMVDVPRARVAHGALHRQHAALPRRVERRLVLLRPRPCRSRPCRPCRERCPSLHL